MRILSLDGGGYMGLATVTFLQEAERHFNVTCHKQFDLFCGTSTGAIIALALAAGKTGREIVALYQQFGTAVFRNPLPGVYLLRRVRGLVLSFYSNRDLRQILSGVFGDLTLGDLRRQGKFVLIPAFNVSSGRPRVFKTNHAPELTLDDDYRVCDIALASAAAPVYLPIVTIRSPTSGVDERFCDGGVFANYPALMAYTEALSHLRKEPHMIQLLSLSTPRAGLAERASAQSLMSRFLVRRGLVAWGSRLASVMIDSTSFIAHQTLCRLVAAHATPGARYERVEFDRPNGIDMDVATPRTTETLVQIGSELARDTPTRKRIEPFFIS